MDLAEGTGDKGQGTRVVPRAAARPSLVYSPHPLLAAANRRIEYSTFLPGESIAGYLERMEIRLGSQPVRLWLNDRRIPRRDWALTVPKQGDLLVIRARVRDGGGGGGKNPLRTILTIAVLIAATVITGPGGLALTGWQAAVVQGVIMVGGSLLINAILPPPAPQLSQSSGRLDNPSPTYSLSGGSNLARPFEPLPIIMGTHRVFPDLGAKPYTEFEGDDQYLYQVFNFGLSDVVLSDYRIGQTPIESFEGVTIEESGPDGALDLFPANVDSAQGAALDAVSVPIVRTSSPDATALAIEITGILVTTDSADGSVTSWTVQASLEYRAVGATDWLPFVDGQLNQNITSASSKPVRRTWWRAVDSGQYEVRVTRLWSDPTDPKYQQQLAWSQLRTYQPDTADYTGQKRVAVKIKASGQLQGTLDQFSALASARCEAWDTEAEEWALTENSNPAWWWRWFAKGKTIGTRRAFGCGLSDARIDEDAVKAFGAWCAAKALTFNAVVDKGMTCLDVLNAIARCGRGSTTLATGKYGVTWDAPGLPFVAVFGMGNINLDTFESAWVTDKLGDEIELVFVNPDLDWQQDSVRAVVPGVTDPVNPVRIELFGCTDKTMAGGEANLIAAAQTYRRRQVSFECDFEGMVASRGDVVMVSHDLFAMSQASAWGRSGRLVSGTADELTLDGPVTLMPDQQQYVGVRYPDSTFEIRPVTIAAGDATVISLDESLSGAPSSDPDGHPACDYLWFFGLNADGPGKLMKVHDVAAVSEDTVRLTLVDENPDYYAAESSAFVYTPPAQFSAPLPVISNLQATEDLVRNADGFAVKLTLTWDVSGNYDHANIRIGIDGAPLSAAGTTTARRFETIVPDRGVASVEVAAMHPLFGAGPDSVAALDHTIAGKSAPPSDVADFTATFDPTATRLRWPEIPDLDRDVYEVRAGTVWETAVLAGRTKSNVLSIAPLAAATDFLIKAFDTSGNPSVNARALTVTPAAPGAVSPSVVLAGADMKLSWPASTGGSYQIRNYEVRYGDTFAGGTSVGFVDVTTFRAVVDWSGSRKWWVQPIDVAGNTGTPSFVGLNITPPSQPQVLAQVIDNNVLLSWTDATTTVPLGHYEVRRGDDFDTAVVIGTVAARFSAIFESTAGSYRYWVEGVDAAGNMGTPGSVLATVSAPPDYVLFDNLVSDFSGTKTNALVVDGRLLVGIDASRTYTQHFTDDSWDQPQDQIDAGFAIYAEPGTTSAQYVENIDYGSVLPATRITVDLASTVVAGSITVTPTISVRKLLTDAWTDFAGQWSVYATDFQYVKITLDFSASGRNDLLYLDSLTTRLDVSLRSDGGTVSAVSTDSGGTTVTFNVEFIDIHAITVTPQGTTAAIAVVDFTDVPNPTSFKVLVFDTAGTRVSRTVRWQAKGV